MEEKRNPLHGPLGLQDRNDVAGDSQVKPVSLGFRMPAEWERHRGTWIIWPHNPDDWPGKLATVRWDFVEMVRHLSCGEQVRILVRNDAEKSKAARMIEKAGVDLGRLEFFHFPTNRSWIRDCGPVFITRGDSLEGDERGAEPFHEKPCQGGPEAADTALEKGRKDRLAINDWRFNGWAKYARHREDDQVPGRIAEALGLTRFQPTFEKDGRSHRVVLEGGSIDVNGAGLLLTTEECLLSSVQARNPGFTREDMEAVFRDCLGVRKVLWLGRGVAGDDTHGHIDDVARFVGARRVIAAEERDPSDINHGPLRENLDRLQSVTDLDGKPLEIVTLPMPRPLYFEGERLPASYLNFYIANTAVLVPTFNDPADREALAILGELFPERQVVGIHSVHLVWGLGTLHCLTQQEPE